MSCTFLSTRVQRHLKLPDCEADDLLACVGSPSPGHALIDLEDGNGKQKTQSSWESAREIIILENTKAYICPSLGVVAVCTLCEMLSSWWPTSQSSEEWHGNNGKCSSHCRPTAIGTRFMLLPLPATSDSVVVCPRRKFSSRVTEQQDLEAS